MISACSYRWVVTPRDPAWAVGQGAGDDHGNDRAICPVSTFETTMRARGRKCAKTQGAVRKPALGTAYVLRAQLIPPKILEPRWRQLRVANRVLNILVPKMGLQGAGVVPLVGQGKPTGMP